MTNLRVAPLKDESSVLVWMLEGQVEREFEIHGQAFNYDGNTVIKFGDPFQASKCRVISEYDLDVSPLEPDGFVVSWVSKCQSNFVNAQPYAQRFSNDGRKLGYEFRYANVTGDHSGDLSITTLAQGKYLEVWSGNCDGVGGACGRIVYDKFTFPSISILRHYTENEFHFFLNNPLRVELYYQPNTTLELTLPKEAGKLLSPTMPNVTSGFKPETATWYATGELQAINELLKAMIFVPNDYYDKPFDVQVRVVDETGYAEPVETSFTMQAIAVDQPPSLVNNTISVKQGQTLLLNNSHLGVYDVDTRAAQLTLTVLDLKNGRFEKSSVPGTSVTTFTQQFINEGKLQFVTDDTGLKPSGKVSLSDGNTNKVGPVPLTFSFTAKRDVNKASIAVPISVASLIALMGGIGLYRYGQHKKEAKTRKDYPLANAIYKKLNLKQVVNFKSKAGREFVRIVNALEEKFNTSHDYTFEVMSLDAIDEFADYLVHAIKQEVLLTTSRFSGATLNLADLELQQARIVKATMTFVEKDSWVPRQGVVKEKYVFDDEESSNALEMSTKNQLKAPLIENELSMH